jgi:hypothetical protein
MADNKTETEERLLIAPEVKERWALVDKEDFPLVMAEYTRQMRDFSKQTNDAVKSIKGWVTLFGILAIIALVVSFLNLILFSF